MEELKNELSERMEIFGEKVGILIGRVDSIERSIERISTAIEAIAGNNARLTIVEDTIVQHRQQLNYLEKQTEVATHQLVELNDYRKNDTPIDVYVGKWAIRVICVVGGLFVGWVLQNMHTIVGMMMRIEEASLIK